MIALFGRDDYAVLGIAAMLDGEKIPYRRVASLDDPGDDFLVVAGTDLTPAECTSLERQRVLIVGGGPAVAVQIFGAHTAQVVERPCRIELDQAIWSSAVADVALDSGKAALRIPLAPLCETRGVLAGTPVVSLAPPQPAVMRLHRCVWSLIDIGSAFANLLSEAYLPSARRSDHTNRDTWARRVAESAYYAAPDTVRRWVQTRCYRRLDRQLESDAARMSEYPTDPTGWLLIELLKALLRLAGHTVVRLERWPAPYRAAAALTHDLEPQRHAYTTGLTRLMRQVGASGHPATFGLVATAAEYHLSDGLARQLATHEVLCHGLEHRGDPVSGRARVTANLQAARGLLERRLGRPIAGYRSPRLDRSDDLAWALHAAGFDFDSSFPDVDRENLNHYGSGVRLNLPYRPLITDDSGRLRQSRCLELPLTAPDCIQPLFAGHTDAMLRAAVAAKARFVRATGGLYVALVHAGVFGDADSARRESHLAFVRQELRHADVWQARLGDIAAWWRDREALQVSVARDTITVCNRGERRVTAARAVVEQQGGDIVLDVPPLAPGEEATISISKRSARGAA